jgi:hypothetical protein
MIFAHRKPMDHLSAASYMRSAVDLMTGATGHLLPKLGEFLKQEHNLQTSMKEDIESIS